MDWQTAYMVIGFSLALYSVIGNDALQTLGTFMSSNKFVHWSLLALMASIVMAATLSYGWYVNNGDLSYGRLTGIPLPDDMTIWYCLPPLILVFLTYFGFPVSTTFLVISVFAKSVIIQQMILKSLVGYVLALFSSYFIWLGLSQISKEHDDSSEDRDGMHWRIAQWLSTGFLWSFWLKQDMANIFVYLPRKISQNELLFILSAITACIFLIFRQGGGKIQEIVKNKTGVHFMRNATFINVVNGFILMFFMHYNTIPMSTTWVFVGLLAGREAAINQLHIKPKRRKIIFPKLVRDFWKMTFGLAVSIATALLVSYFLI
ncbi:MAG: hypothetical protein WC323_01075 [Patescibacteria group bacterium]|jgi:hypothetical protein